MCGIAGWIDWDKDLASQQWILDKMVETLAARGPDASGMYFAQNAAIGHRRLSVVDLEGGKQPMIRRRGDRTFVITYNGELYNTPELRQELEARGHSFTTSSDTEVLLRSFIEWGPACAERLNGIFAFGVWDEKEKSLFLCRDRIGVKPLFYARVGNGIVFGSELKALLAHPCIRPRLGPEGLAEVFMLGPARTPGHGIYEGVAELKPGCCMTFNKKGMRIWPYWKLESFPHEESFDATLAHVRELVQDAVNRQLVSDVPLCTLLSGGLDSSAITAFAASAYKSEGRLIQTYSVDYKENDKYFQANSFQPNSDAPWVDRVSKCFATAHQSVVIDNTELAEVLEEATFARDLPGMADVDTSLYLFSREIKKSATVGLSGECADEVFGGYPWFYREDMINANTFPWASGVEARVKWLSPALRETIRPMEYVADRYHEAIGEVPVLKGEDPVAARRREIFYLSLTRFMPTLLDRKDRMSMAFGLELRVPFCDHRIVEYVWNVPWSFKNYRDREKGLLRQALTGILPDDVLWRKKSPYPKTHNPLFLDIVRRRVLEILNDPSSPLIPLVDVDKIRNLAVSDPVSSPLPWFGQLMGEAQLFAYLIQIDTWLREYKVEII